MHPNFKAKYPKSCNPAASGGLALAPVITATARVGRDVLPMVEHGGFDSDDVLAALGQSRFNNLMAGVKSVFSCGHRLKNGVEVHCVYAADLESFLNNGG
jgi:hypothetical protein